MTRSSLSLTSERDCRARRMLGGAILAMLLSAGALSTPNTASANTDPNTPIIRYDGQRGQNVWCIQFILKNFAGHPNITIDSTYGPETRQGVIDVQRFFGLPLDGEVGPRTGEAFKFIINNAAGPGTFGICQTLVPTLT